MNFTINVSGLDEVRDTLKALSGRRMNAAIATGLTRTALQVRDELRTQLRSRLDRPTPYAMNSLYVITAVGNASNAGLGSLPVPGSGHATRLVRSRHLEAEVGIKDEAATTGGGTPAVNFLRPNIDGGARRTKRLERALQIAGLMPNGWQITPGPDARLDAYGNVSRGQIVQILSQLRVTQTAGYTRNMPFPNRNGHGQIVDGPDSRKVRSAVKRAGGRYFITKLGIFQREHHASSRPLMILRFVRTSRYKPIFDFHGIARSTAGARLRDNVNAAIAEHIARINTRTGGSR